MTDYPTEWVDAAGRAICRDGWDVPAERAAHIGSMRAVLAQLAPLIRAATLREAADRLEANDADTMHPPDQWTRGYLRAVADLRRWAEEG